MSQKTKGNKRGEWTKTLKGHVSTGDKMASAASSKWI